MAPIIQRYIRNEVLPPFLLALSVFTLLLLMQSAMDLSNMVIAKGVEFRYIAKIVAYSLPSIFSIAIPMAFLMASLTAMGRLSADSEVIAMHALGMGTAHFIKPVLKLGISLFIVTFLVGAFAVPWGTASANQLLFKLLREHVAAGMQTKTFNDRFTDLVLYAEEVSKDGRTVNKLMISDYRGENPEMILAAAGEIQTNRETLANTLNLTNGSIHQYNARENRYRLIHFDQYKLSLTTDRESEKQRALLNEKKPADMSPAELKEAVRRATPEEAPRYRVHYYEKTALPFSCIIFGLFSIPLGIRFKRSGKIIGFSWSLMIIFLYYIILGLGRNFGSEGIIPAALAAWL
ncbi:MAG: LPS export ABC transporter permease LptF, partial [bacterium]|nr:LPS export ABC transporter permease LptF [bacterium]